MSIIWTDKKRTFLGLPLSFTTYTLEEERLFIRAGFLTIVEDEVAKRIIELVNGGVRVHLLKGMCSVSRETGEKSPYADEFAKLVTEGKIHTVPDGDTNKLLDCGFEGGIIRTQQLQKKLMKQFVKEK